MSRKYSEWVLDYPDRVVIRKEGYFYTARENSAYIIATILDYRIGYLETGGVMTGSPSLDIMIYELKNCHISYVVIIDDVVIDEVMYDDNNYWKYVDRTSNQIMMSKLKKETLKCENSNLKKNNNHLIKIIDALMEGIDPYTGELLDSNHLIMSNDVQTILSEARNVFEEKEVAKEISESSLDDNQNDLYNHLKQLRTTIAREKKIPAYVIFNNRSLVEMAYFYPTTREDMLKISGVGEKSFDNYGQLFLDEISKHMNL